MLPFGPNGHLDETHQGEEGHRQTLGHQGEAEPRAQLWEEEVTTFITAELQLLTVGSKCVPYPEASTKHSTQLELV